MTSRIKILFIALLSFSSSNAREWTSSDGTKKIKADFISYENGVLLISRDGVSTKTVPTQFSKEDQAWIELAVQVKTKTKPTQGFMVYIRTSDGQCLCRMALDASKRPTQSNDSYETLSIEKLYRGEYFILPKDDPFNSKIGVSESQVKTLYWGGVRPIHVDPKEQTRYPYWYWEDWRFTDAQLSSYYTSFEAAVDALYASRTTRDTPPPSSK